MDKQERTIVDYKHLAGRELYWCKRRDGSTNWEDEWIPVALLHSRDKDSLYVETVFDSGARQTFDVPRHQLFTPMEMFTVHRINPIQYNREKIEKIRRKWNR